MLNFAQTRAPLAGLLATVSAIFASPALGAQADGRNAVDRIDGLAAVAGFSVRDSGSGTHENVDIFVKVRRDLRLPDGSPWIEFIARRQSATPNGDETTTWAHSEDCPALRNTLIWLTTLVAPRIEIPGITPNEGAPIGRRPITVMEDGLQTLVWGRGTQPDHVANTRVEIESNGGLIAQFGRAASENLVGCWRPTRD
jgi:hypothetical protein